MVDFMKPMPCGREFTAKRRVRQAKKKKKKAMFQLVLFGKK